jgi:metal-responsive CopG/Arc/MetJ family transcriptional regulator
MTVTRWAISLDEMLAREIKRSAAGEPISAWLADAARSKLRREAWRELISEYEAEHGTITDAEMDAVRDHHSRLRRRKPPVRRKRRT